MAEKSDFNDQAKSKGKLSVAKKIGTAIDAATGLIFGFFIIKPDGVLVQRPDDKTPAKCFSHIKPLAICRTVAGVGVSILFEMLDIDNKKQQLILRSEDQHSGAGEIHRAELARRGFRTFHGCRLRNVWPDFFNAVLQHSSNLPRMILTTMTGWHLINGRHIYVRPGEVIGDCGNEKIINPSMPNPADHAPAGTLATWQREVSRYAAKNSRLALGLCTSFTAPILAVLQEEPAIIQIFGASSEGKTTTLFMALSAWGNPRDLMKTWNSTGNALVALLSQRNDGLLALDEQKLCNPEQAGHTVYVLTSGTVKSRLKKDSTLQETEKFCTMGLSTGEKTLSDFMSQSRHKLQADAGQEVRMLDVPADPGAGLGVFDDLCGFENGAALSDHLKQATTKNHGVAIRAFLKQLVEDRNDRPEQLLEVLTGHIKRFLADYLPTGADGQVHRACHRFGIIAAAGELAINYGVLPFPEGDAAANVGMCFSAWLSRRGTCGKLEISRLLDQVEAFFDTHGEARFVPLQGDDRANNRPVINRAGFNRVVSVAASTETRMEYFVLPSVFREICTGFDHRWAVRRLAETGIIKGSNGKNSIMARMPGMGLTRVYHFPCKGADDEKPQDIPF